MEEQERAGFADQWLRKYGESIDSDGLIDIASLLVVRTQEYEEAALLQLQAAADFVKNQRDAWDAFMAADVPGMSTSLEELREKMIRSPADSRWRYIPNGSGRLPRGYQSSQLPRVWWRFVRCAEMIKEIEWQLKRAADWVQAGKRGRGRAPDQAFRRACHLLGEWIRERHRDCRGRRDGKTSWDDVAACLEWHGLNLNHMAHKATACRLAARRYREQKSAADGV